MSQKFKNKFIYIDKYINRKKYPYIKVHTNKHTNEHPHCLCENST